MTSSHNPSDAGLARLTGWALRYGLRRWGLLIALLSLMLVHVGLQVLRPWPVVFLVDHVLQAKAGPGWLQGWVAALPGTASAEGLIAWCVGATVLIFLFTWAVGLGSAYVNVSLGQHMTYDLAADLLARLQQLSLRFHAGSRVGDNIRRVTADSSCLSTILKDALLPVITAVISLVTMFGILWQINAPLTLLALAVVPFMALVFHRYAQPMLDKSYTQQEVDARIYAEVEQTLSAIPMVQAFGRESEQDGRFAQANQDSLAATLSLTHVQLKFKLWMGLATALGTAFILWQGTRQAVHGDASVGPGAIILFLSYLGSLYAPLEAIMYTSCIVQGAAGSARRVLEIFATKQEVTDKPGAAALRAERGRVQLEGVTFGYERDRPVLQNISLEVEPGQMVALVGPTGVGKSTLVSLVPRFYDPWSGRVLVDGQDVREVRLKSLRQHVALVLQEPFLFPMSIGANIGYGRSGANPAEVEAAARAARAHEFIARLPQGYNTVVGERGVTLSGGERQRVAVARALLKNAPILILDEPTSALDVETEQALMEALARLMQDRTTLLIAHRLSTVRRADRILMLEAGRLAESGTHDQLLALNGIYARWYRLQTETQSNPATT
jgi:ATP-binding cassette subfamily B protein